jgi:hypothetical protein
VDHRSTGEHDYPAALSYLSLLYDEQKATTYVDKLKHVSVSEFKAKDIFRVSGLSLLGISNSHVKKDQQKIQAGRALSPLLLIRDSGMLRAARKGATFAATGGRVNGCAIGREMELARKDVNAG